MICIQHFSKLHVIEIHVGEVWGFVENRIDVGVFGFWTRSIDVAFMSQSRLRKALRQPTICHSLDW